MLCFEHEPYAWTMVHLRIPFTIMLKKTSLIFDSKKCQGLEDHTCNFKEQKRINVS